MKPQQNTFKSTAITIILVIFASILFLLPSAFAQGENLSTPTPYGTPPFPEATPGEIPSAEEQEELKAIVQSYIEIRYRALSVSDSEDFKQNGFGNLVSDTHEAEVFLREENAKLRTALLSLEIQSIPAIMRVG